MGTDKSNCIGGARIAMMRLVLLALLMLSVITATSRAVPARHVRALASSPVAKPSPQQLEWQDLEVSAMLGWNLQSFCLPDKRAGAPLKHTTQRCQASSRTEGPLYVPTLKQVSEWNPAALDTDAWARAAASFGAKYIVAVADHMTGFTWWDTKYHNYSIAHTQYKGGGADLLKEMIASCKKFNLRLGFFYSVHYNWFLGVDGFDVGHPPLGPRSYTPQEFQAIAIAQLQEAIESFGQEGPLEIWFDGGTGPYAEAISKALMHAAPNAICHSCWSNFTKAGSVRWMGNEQAVMPVPSWGADDGEGSKGGGGNPNGAAFMPPSSDAVLREHYWFYQHTTTQATKTTKKLVHNYLTSVGRSSNLILNIAPDETGAIPPGDVQRYAQMGTAVACLFGKPQANSAGQLQMDMTTGMIEWSHRGSTSSCANCSLVLREEQSQGQLIGNYTIDCQTNAGWSPCKMGSLEGVISNATHLTGVGHKRILMIQVSEPLLGIRLMVESHFATGVQIPALRDMALFDWSGEIKDCV